MGLNSYFDLSGKTALVTGGSKGLGKSFALALAEAGADIAVVSRTLGDLAKVKDDIESLDRQAFAIEVDITKEEQVAAMVQETVEKFGKIDILVNNAATGRINKPPESTTMDDWSFVIDTNVTGPFLCARAAGQQMIKQGRGKIINLASICGRIIPRYVHGGSYDVSKHAVVAFTRALAVAWARYNITVNAIAPGFFRTEPNEGFFESNPGVYEKLVEMTPLGRIAEPRELGGLVIFLASDSSNYMTGSVIIMDGGHTLW